MTEKLKPAEIVHVEQNTQRWFDMRAGIPTASRFVSICTAAKGEYPKVGSRSLMYELIAEALGEKDDYVSEDMYFGSALESKAIRWYEMAHGIKVQRDVFLQGDGYGASPDGLVSDDGGIETKCPKIKTHIKYLDQNVLPVEYRPQVHGLLAVSGRKWWDFVSFVDHSLPPFYIRVRPDEYTEKITANLIKFKKEFAELKERLGFKV